MMNIKRYIAAILAFVLLICSTYALPAQAETVTVNRFGHVTGSDGTFTWRENGRDLELDYFYFGQADIENQIYCIDHSASLYNGSQRDKIECSLTNGSTFWNSLTDAAKQGVLITLLYGFNGKDNVVPSALASRDSNISTMDYLAATQYLIWEYTAGYRTSYNNCTNPIYYNIIRNRPAGKAYLYILEQTASHRLKSSFLSEANNPLSAQNLQFKWNETNQRYEIKVGDLNGFDIDWVITSPSDVSVTRSGSEYTFYSTNPSAGQISVRKGIDSALSGSSTEYSVFTYSATGMQELIHGKMNPFYYYINTTVESTASVNLTKQSDDNNVDGFSFSVSGANLTTPVTGITDVNGHLQFPGLKAGTYTISEIQKSLAYRIWDPITIRIQNGMTSYDVYANNETRMGTVTITKTCEGGGSVKGFDFTLTGKVYDGDGNSLEAVKDISITETTDANGVAVFYVPVNMVVQGGTTYKADNNGFTITEAASPVYEPLTPITNVFVTDNNDTPLSVNNTLKRGTVTVYKQSSDHNVEGFEFWLHGYSLSGEEVSMTAFSNASGVAVFNDVLVSDSSGYEVEEINYPVQYEEPDTQTVQVSYGINTSTIIINARKQFSVLISKVSDIGRPVEGALLGVFSSNDRKLGEGRTDSAGLYSTPKLTVGYTYQIKELEAPEGYILNTEPITFTLNNDGTVTGDLVIVNQREAVPTATPAPTIEPTPAPTLAPVPTIPPTPQTGDNRNIGLWAGVLGAAVVAVTVILIVGKKKKKKTVVEW